MFVYASKEFNNVVIQVFTVLEVDTSRTKVQLINGVQIPQQYNIMGEWAENGRYNVNDWVTYGNGIYLCIKNIANSATIPPLDKTNFKFIGGEKSKTTIVNWQDTRYTYHIAGNLLKTKIEIDFYYKYSQGRIALNISGFSMLFTESARFNGIKFDERLFYNVFKESTGEYSTTVTGNTINTIEVYGIDANTEFSAYIKIKEYYE